MSPDLITPAAVPIVSIEETKLYLRIDGGAEDALLAQLIRVSLNLAEQFLGFAPLASRWRQTLPGWPSAPVALLRTPLRGTVQAVLVKPDGSTAPIAASLVSLSLDAYGAAWVMLRTTGETATAIRLEYEAGLASDWNGAPEAIRQGVLRLAAHLYTHRDSAAETELPAAVTALWRPYRQTRLT
jgi:uncharacterized phiE125 gp8 family phage protein